MSNTLTSLPTTTLEDIVRHQQHVDPAVPKLIQRLKEQAARYAKASWEGKVAYSSFLLTRMEATNKRILDLLNDAEPCCDPYRTARHTGNCRTVTHAPMMFANADSGLTSCGLVGPIVDGEPTCDTCAGRPIKPGADTYPGVLHPLTARQYDLAVEEARDWLYEHGLEPHSEPWKVWNRINAQYEGGVEAFVNAVTPLLSA